MTAETQRSTWPVWTLAAILAAPVFYLASIGPLAGLANRDQLPAWSLPPLMLYVWPVEAAYASGPGPLHDAVQCYIDWYIDLWR